MTRYSIESRTKKYVKGQVFLSFARKCKKNLFDTKLYSLKNASKKVVHKTGEFLRNKIAEAVTNSYNDKIMKANPVEEIIIPPEKREEILNQIKTSIIRMEHFKISKILNDSVVSKFVTRKQMKVNDLSSRQYSVNSINKIIRFKTSILRSVLSDYSDAYIFVKGSITVEGDNNDKTKDKKQIFENNAPFRSCMLHLDHAYQISITHL